MYGYINCNDLTPLPLTSPQANMQRLGPLPPGWQEMPSPEGTYYYSESGVSTWDRPRA